MGIAVLFPGQGSQYVGMATPHLAASPVVADTLAEADGVLGFPLSRLVAEGPEERLAETRVTQPAILAVSVALWRLLRERLPGLEVLAGAGHSLGEYSALVAAGALDYADALRLVRLRGEVMQEAVPQGVGGMVAVLGLDPPAIRALCASAAEHGVVGPACFNGPGQVVVAGHRSAVDRVAGLARDAGARDVVSLNVSAPFHTPLLRRAGEQLAAALAEVEVRRPAFPVIQNVDALPHTDPDGIRANLVAQVSCPVQWEDCARRLLAMGAERFVEVGPGRTLSGLVKKLDRRAPVVALDRSDAWELLHA